MFLVLYKLSQTNSVLNSAGMRGNAGDASCCTCDTRGNAMQCCRFMGVPRGWRKMRCALVPYYPSVTSPVTELELLFIDEQVFTLVDLIRVTHSRSEPYAIPGKLHVDLVSLPNSAVQKCCSNSIWVMVCMRVPTLQVSQLRSTGLHSLG